MEIQKATECHKGPCPWQPITGFVIFHDWKLIENGHKFNTFSFSTIKSRSRKCLELSPVFQSQNPKTDHPEIITIGNRLTVLRWIRSTTDYLDFMEDLDNNKITPIVIISTPVQSGHPMTDLFIQALILRHHRRQKTTIKLKGINC